MWVDLVSGAGPNALLPLHACAKEIRRNLPLRSRILSVHAPCLCVLLKIVFCLSLFCLTTFSSSAFLACSLDTQKNIPTHAVSVKPTPAIAVCMPIWSGLCRYFIVGAIIFLESEPNLETFNDSQHTRTTQTQASRFRDA